MVTWTSSETSIPPVNTENKWDNDNKISKTVLVRVVGRAKNFSGYSFARYFHQTQHWSIDGYRGTFDVSHWTEINNIIE